MFFDPDYASFVHSHSALRLRVTAPTDPPISRTFDICRGAPLSWLGESFLLSTGRTRPDGPDEESGWYGDVDSIIPRASWQYGGMPLEPEAGPTLSIPGMAGDCRVEVLDDATATVVGEPHVRIVDGTPDTPRAVAAWELSPASFHIDHVQHELTREFGLVLPDRESVCFHEMSRAFGDASALRPLAEALAPLQRLALRSHLEDAELMTAPLIDAAAARSLTHGLAWLIDRIGAEGMEQDEHGWLPVELAREAEQALEWVPAPGAPPSPGHALLSTARSLRFIRRFKGRVIPVAHTRELSANPLRAVRELGSGAQRRSQGYSWSGQPDHAETLALLAVADGTATASVDLNERVMNGLAALDENQEYPYRQTTDAERESSAKQAVTSLMEVLAPLGGHGGYGLFTPAVRAFAHSLLR
ncbi:MULTISPECIES: hypothetical protein [Actinomycetes]|uniref:Uncharacterized protein n=1 Tax=Microbacterium profundi TaxID=450380 RepID=A0ABV3LKN7_9MICO|nr:hypothetical protein [Microbacterium profundi]MCE7480995.1 hypothetical protein [Microbacterium profundi]